MVRLERHTLVRADGRRLHVYGGAPGQLDDELPPPESEPSQHLRLDPLTSQWIVVSPARNTRPQTDRDPGCPLCPGGPEAPFAYAAAVFDNRFPSFLAAVTMPEGRAGDRPGRVAPAFGRCEVVLYTPRHEGSLATLIAEEVCRVVAVWRDRSEALWADPAHEAVLVFENRGEAVGATLSHPHGQIYAFGHLPPGFRTRRDALDGYRHRTRRCLHCDVVEQDDAATERTVAKNDTFTVATPFAPRWPYELHVRARRHGLRRLGDLTPDEQLDLARALHDVVGRYDRVHPQPMSYMMTILEAPGGAADWHLAVEFLPPHRSPDKLKIRASVETVAGTFINDTSPEHSAEELASLDIEPFAGDRACVPDIVPTDFAPGSVRRRGPG